MPDSAGHLLRLCLWLGAVSVAVPSFASTIRPAPAGPGGEWVQTAGLGLAPASILAGHGFSPAARTGIASYVPDQNALLQAALFEQMFAAKPQQTVLPSIAGVAEPIAFAAVALVSMALGVVTRRKHTGKRS